MSYCNVKSSRASVFLVHSEERKGNDVIPCKICLLIDIVLYNFGENLFFEQEYFTSLV